MTFDNENGTVMTNLGRKHVALVALLAVNVAVVSDVFAHPGGLNAEGCHNNRKTGDYHCHRSQQVPTPVIHRSPASVPGNADSLQQLVAPSQHHEPTQERAQLLQTSSATKPTCHTGPRGGTYTITASGRKNYGGC
jgi:hypothetical protein